MSAETSGKKLCAMCKNHGLSVPFRGHTSACPFPKCNCTLCELTRQRRKIMARQIKLRRQFEKSGIAAADDTVQQTTGSAQTPDNRDDCHTPQADSDESSHSDDSNGNSSSRSQGETSSQRADRQLGPYESLVEAAAAAAAAAATSPRVNGNGRLRAAASDWLYMHRGLLPDSLATGSEAAVTHLKLCLRSLILCHGGPAQSGESSPTRTMPAAVTAPEDSLDALTRLGNGDVYDSESPLPSCGSDPTSVSSVGSRQGYTEAAAAGSGILATRNGAADAQSGLSSTALAPVAGVAPVLTGVLFDLSGGSYATAASGDAGLQPKPSFSPQLLAGFGGLSAAKAMDCRVFAPPQAAVALDQGSAIRSMYGRLSANVSAAAARQRQAYVAGDPALFGDGGATQLYCCRRCALSFWRRRDLEFHFWTHTSPPTPHLCHVCGECFATRRDCAVHGNEHGLHDFICQLCGVLLPLAPAMQDHWENFHFDIGDGDDVAVMSASSSAHARRPRHAADTATAPLSFPALTYQEVEKVLAELPSGGSGRGGDGAPRDPPSHSFVFVNVDFRRPHTVEYRPKDGIDADPEYRKFMSCLPV